MRPRLTASSTTSWRRSRESVTLCSSASRKASTLLSARPAPPVPRELVLVLVRVLFFVLELFEPEREPLELFDFEPEREPPDLVAIETPLTVSRPHLRAG